MRILFLTLIIIFLNHSACAADCSYKSRFKGKFIKFLTKESIYLWEVTPYRTKYSTTISYEVKSLSPKRLFKHTKYYCEGPTEEPNNQKLKKYVERPKPYIISLTLGFKKKYYIIRENILNRLFKKKLIDIERIGNKDHSDFTEQYQKKRNFLEKMYVYERYNEKICADIARLKKNFLIINY